MESLRKSGSEGKVISGGSFCLTEGMFQSQLPVVQPADGLPAPSR
ncbi:MAG: hypothetical protein AB7T22_15920 [Calditrichaceae bacterium]